VKKLNIEKLLKSNYVGYKANVPDLPIKLSRNENPYDIPKEIKEEILNELLNTPWNRYPDGQSLRLRNKLAEFLNLSAENILVGTGSGELIQLVFNGFLEEGDRVILPVPTFPLYEKLLQQRKIEIIKVFLNKEDFSLNFDLLKNYFQYNPKILVITNPNNPTGNFLLKKEDFEKIKDFPGIILIDEAYYEFSGLTFLSHTETFPNVIILRTFSKAFSGAGIRLGYLISNSKIVGYLDNFKLPYNVNVFTQIAGERLIEKWDLLKNRIEIIKRERDRVFEEMQRLKDIKVYPSETNFILFRSEKIYEILKKCEEEGIALRDFSKEPLLENCLRVSIGDRRENDIFIKVLKEVCI
jgi:histidinol-phosphate aminotransferase